MRYDIIRVNHTRQHAQLNAGKNKMAGCAEKFDMNQTKKGEELLALGINISGQRTGEISIINVSKHISVCHNEQSLFQIKEILQITWVKKRKACCNIVHNRLEQYCATSIFHGC